MKRKRRMNRRPLRHPKLSLHRRSGHRLVQLPMRKVGNEENDEDDRLRRWDTTVSPRRQRSLRFLNKLGYRMPLGAESAMPGNCQTFSSSAAILSVAAFPCALTKTGLLMNGGRYSSG